VHIYNLPQTLTRNRPTGFEREFEGEDKVVADGYIHMLEPLRASFLENGGRILLSTPVKALAHDEDAGLVRATDDAGTQYTAKSVICTLPLGVLKESPPAFDPPLPARREDAISKVGFGLLNKAILTYPTLWWPADLGAMHIFLPPAPPGAETVDGEPANFAAEGATADGDALPPGLAIRALFAQSYYPLTQRPVLMFFFGGAHGEALERLSTERVQAWLHAALARCLLRLPGAPASAPEPLGCTVTRWSSDPLARGSYAYTRISEPGEGEEHASPLHMVELSRPLWDTRLGFAGEHTELDHFASAHGPAVSGWREAERVHAALEGPWAELRKEAY
jgi:polyamine oxidase